MMKRLEIEAAQLSTDMRFIIKSMIGVGLTTDGYSGDQKLKYHVDVSRAGAAGGQALLCELCVGFEFRFCRGRR